MRALALVRFPAIFFAGWLFNFVVDIQFLSGFAAGWLAHTWLGGILF
jgi:hypothetical protein